MALPTIGLALTLLSILPINAATRDHIEAVENRLLPAVVIKGGLSLTTRSRNA